MVLAIVTIHSPTDLLHLMGILAEGMAEGFDFDTVAYASMDEESVDTIAEAVGNEGLPDLHVAYRHYFSKPTAPGTARRTGSTRTCRW